MELTPRQQQILRFIQDFVAKQGYPPTVREIAQDFGIDYRAVIDHLRALERKGALVRSSKSRGIRIRGSSAAVQYLPVLGRVAAGSPREAIEEIEETIPVPEEWARGFGLFIVRVDREGMSMSPTILPHDYLLVKEDASFEEGDIVLALIEGEVTVKRLHREEGAVLLKSDNPAMPLISIQEGNRNLRILGRVIGVAFRRL